MSVVDAGNKTCNFGSPQRLRELHTPFLIQLTRPVQEEQQPVYQFLVPRLQQRNEFCLLLWPSFEVGTGEMTQGEPFFYEHIITASILLPKMSLRGGKTLRDLALRPTGL